MNILLFDDPATKTNLLPFTFTRPVADLRIGILTIREKWEKMGGSTCSYLTEDYLATKFPAHFSNLNLFINGSIIPDARLLEQCADLKDNEVLLKDDKLIAYCGPAMTWQELTGIRSDPSTKKCPYFHEIFDINHPWDIFIHNAEAVRRDFALITKGRKSAPITDPHTIIYGKENIFLEENVSVKAAVLNAENGPIYLGANAEVHEGAMIRGASAICENAVVSMGGRIRGDTTIGPYCKVGGEISNSVVMGYSSKAHDGYLGNSVLGQWCNLGADTNTSNLKNNYTNVKIWNYRVEGLKDTGRQFCGLMMGDHSKCSINTMFNTGTVVGVSANIFGGGFPPKFIPSFSWGGAEHLETYQFEKALEVIPRVYERRKKNLLQEDVDILKYIFEFSKKYRKFS